MSFRLFIGGVIKRNNLVYLANITREFSTDDDVVSQKDLKRAIDILDPTI